MCRVIVQMCEKQSDLLDSFRDVGIVLVESILAKIRVNDVMNRCHRLDLVNGSTACGTRAPFYGILWIRRLVLHVVGTYVFSERHDFFCACSREEKKYAEN